MDDITFATAAQVSHERLTDAFNHAFEGYYVPMRHTPESLATMIVTNDVQLPDSVLALDASGVAVGLALLAKRGARGWVAGMAVAPEWRGRHLGTMIMGRLLDSARQRGLRTVQLEVLDQNIPARGLYTGLGFAEVRQLDVYTGALSVPAAARTPAPARHGVPVEVGDVLGEFPAYHTTQPPWQRERDSLAHMALSLNGLGLRDEAAMQAYILYTSSGTGYSVLDFGSRAVTPDVRVEHGEWLLSELTRDAVAMPVRAINVPPGDALGDALARLECPLVTTQREMLYDLT
jgi:ribosomal protein S18 acetylase RimI-like enzyme